MELIVFDCPHCSGESIPIGIVTSTAFIAVVVHCNDVRFVRIISSVSSTGFVVKSLMIDEDLMMIQFLFDHLKKEKK